MLATTIPLTFMEFQNALMMMIDAALLRLVSTVRVRDLIIDRDGVSFIIDSPLFFLSFTLLFLCLYFVQSFMQHAVIFVCFT